MNIDMHFHSTRSDGKNTPKERIRQIQEKKLDFVALTDHDVISGGFQYQGELSGINSCQSVEISARDTVLNRSLHITAYSKKFSQDVYDILENTRDGKEQMITSQITKLQTLGFDIQADLFFQNIQKIGRNNASANKFDIAQYLLQDITQKNQNLADRITGADNIGLETFFLSCFKETGYFYPLFQARIKDYEPSLEVCKNIQQQCNAILALAHPNITFKGGISEFRKQLPHYIKNSGINAIEINAIASQKWVEAIMEVKEKYGLYITFGSDNHKYGYTDSKHGDLGDQNPHTTPEFRKQCFGEYSDIISTK